MVIKYELDFLLSLQNSPLCTRPDNLPPLEEWMGSNEQQQQSRQPSQSTRSQQLQMGRFDKNTLTDDPDDIVFGPPRTSFTSAGRNKLSDNDRIIRDSDGTGRFANLRNRVGDADAERFRDGRNTNSLRRREGGDQDSEGWSTVKPRKSFGADGAEKFLQGRMGGSFRDEKRTPRDREERSVRLYEGTNRDNKDGEEDGRPRNGLARHKTENSESRVPEKRERMDRAKSWRERDPEAEAVEDHVSSRTDHRQDRRWGGGRDQRGEREPEWFDEPAAPQAEARTQEDFKKWLADMKKSKGEATTTSAGPASAPLSEPAQEKAKPPVRPSPAVAPGPDKFFAAFGSPSDQDGGESKPSAAKPSGKSSRFTSFFNQEAPKTEPATSAAAAPPPPPSGMNGLLGALAGMSSTPGQNTNEEKQAFQLLLSKLQKQTMSSSPGGVSPFTAPPQPQLQQQVTPGDNGPKGAMRSPFQEGGLLGRPPLQHHTTDIHAPRPQQNARPEQLLQDLSGQQQHQRVSSQSSSRADVPQRSNSNTEFLMNLMRAGSDGPRTDSAMLRAAQQANKQNGPGPMPHPHDRETEFGPDGRGPQGPRMRPGPPPGFGMDESFRGGDSEYRGPPPPTQILQRPQPPPGLDRLEQGPPPGFISGPGGPLPPHLQQHQASQQPPPPPPPPQQQTQQQRHMIAPPGLVGGGPGGPAIPGRNGPLPPAMAGMFPPNMRPMPPHPEHLGNMPPRGMGPPPPGFFNGPPHGFMPPGMGGFNGPPGPEFAGGLYERGMPPPNGGRGGNFRG
ncbi:uncharacterized protein J7T54_000374 [Emericellopsis cladophorae]|uniref:Uncharacterized protein n=1 Tax=Emericellopsis cladophorae TaxID=2686198 RepID=A0A9P9XVC0_9HYPO|nr:uncharacterized protein J7T54_000374 [Emericellopsis cladophorae]KAI6778479.1 hypothetical protein J7T54_000374 [Emericellopsis cladophorae]